MGAISEIPSTDSQGLLRPDDPLRLRPTKPMGPPTLLTVAFPYEWLVLADASHL